ncbi:hypothetical protein AB0C06_32530 [Micromonospora inaquosa]|uniref:hypothetical protein n=1 Tax=Micromonospora inaquosa TaxID=2203716 RepID=UPI0033FC953D
MWYGWEQARLQMTGMLPWLRELDHQLPIRHGDDGPFRNCNAGGDLGSTGTARRLRCRPSPPQRAGGAGGTDSWSGIDPAGHDKTVATNGIPPHHSDGKVPQGHAAALAEPGESASSLKHRDPAELGRFTIHPTSQSRGVTTEG